jgi:hypothetical protein
MRIPTIILRALHPNLFVQHVVERSGRPVGKSVHRVALTVTRCSQVRQIPYLVMDQDATSEYV